MNHKHPFHLVDPSPWQIGFQDPATPTITGIIHFHNHLIYFLVLACNLRRSSFIKRIWDIARVVFTAFADSNVNFDSSLLLETHLPWWLVLLNIAGGLCLIATSAYFITIIYKKKRTLYNGLTIALLFHCTVWLSLFSAFCPGKTFIVGVLTVLALFILNRLDISTSKTVRENYYSYLEGLKNNQDFIEMRRFWKEDFPKRKNERLLNKIWEYPVLILISTYTGLRTTYVPVSHFLTWLIIQQALFDQSFSLLLLFWGPLLILTVAISIDGVTNYFKSLYGDNALKRLGWNASVNTAKFFGKDFLKKGATIAGSGGLIYGFTEGVLTGSAYAQAHIAATQYLKIDGMMRDHLTERGFNQLDFKFNDQEFKNVSNYLTYKKDVSEAARESMELAKKLIKLK